MNYQTILSQPAVALRDMSLEQFTTLFDSVNAEVEEQEAIHTASKWNFGTCMDEALDLMQDRIERIDSLAKLRIAKQNLTMHRHYAAYCEAQDRKHWDAVYHRPLPA
jgi:hypothetical protein